jgi:hypothetical protein
VLSAGQFAHVQPSDIERALDRLYMSYERQPLGRPDHPEEWAVPYVLVQAWEGGFLAEQAFHSNTVNYLGERLGVVCCLCLCIETERRGVKGGWTVPDAFVAFLSPTAIPAATGWSRVPDLGQPLCKKCKAQIGAKIYRDYGMMEMAKRTDAEWLSILTWLLKNDAFRLRVELYARNVSRLRFDPRRAQ